MMSAWQHHLLSVINNSTKLEMSSRTAGSHPKAVQMLSTSVTQHLTDDFRPQVPFHTMVNPCLWVLTKLKALHNVSTAKVTGYVKSHDKQQSI